MSHAGLDPLEQARAAWAHAYEGLTQEQIDQRVLGFSALVRGIARTGAVTPEEFSRETALSSERATELFTGLAAFGLERDGEGRVVGAALTTRRTPHAVAVAGKSLFAWCALDTLFIPGLLGEIAEVESTCPLLVDARRTILRQIEGFREAAQERSFVIVEAEVRQDLLDRFAVHLDRDSVLHRHEVRRVEM